MSTQQAMVALEKANAVRAARKATRARIERGEISLLEALQNVPPEIAGVKVEQFLRWGPHVGQARARHIAMDLGALSLGSLSWQQRQALARRLPERCRKPFSN